MDLKLYYGVFAEQYESTYLKKMVDLLKEELEMFKLEDIPLDDKKVLSQFNLNKGLLGIDDYFSDFMYKLLDKVQVNCIKDIAKINNLAHSTGLWIDNGEILIIDKKLDSIITCEEDILNFLSSKNISMDLINDIKPFLFRDINKNKDKWLKIKNKLVELNVDKWFIDSCEKILYIYPFSKSMAYAYIHYYLIYIKVYYPLIYYRVILDKNMFAIEKEVVLGGIDIINKYISNENLLIDEEHTYNICLEMINLGYTFQDYNLFKSDVYNHRVINNSFIFPLCLFIPKLSDSVLGNKLLNESELNRFKDITDLKNRIPLNQQQIDELEKLNLLTT